MVIFIPNQHDPGNVLLMHEFVPKLEQQSSVLNFQVKDSHPSFVFRFADQMPSSQGMSLRISILGFLP